MRLSGACEGIRVLDLSRGAAGSLTTMVLADYGADVVRVEPPEVDAVDSAGATPAYLLLQRGKRSITLDLGTDEGRAALGRLLPGIDVVVTNEPGDDLLDGHPALVVCSITGFGTSGPFADVEADDWLAMAKAGIYRDQPGWERDGKRPIYRSCPEGSYFAGMLAVLGILGALRARDLTGRGQRLDLNMLLAITCRQNPQVRSLRREGEPLPVDQAASTEAVSDAINPLAHHRDPREVTLTGMLVECKDGRWIMHSLSEPHFFPAWIEAIGFGWIWDDERFSGAPCEVPRRRRQGRAGHPAAGADEGEDLGRVDRGVPRERQRLRRRHPDDEGRPSPSPGGRRRPHRRTGRPPGRAHPADRPAGQDPHGPGRGAGAGAGPGPAHRGSARGRGRARRGGRGQRASPAWPARGDHRRRGRLLLRHPVRYGAAGRAGGPGHQGRARRRRPLPPARAGRGRPGRRPRPQQHGPGHAGQGVDRPEPQGRAGP